MGISQRTEKSMVRAMCGAQFIDRKRSMNTMFMLGLNETIDQLTMTSSVHWYGYVLRREDGHLLRQALYFEVKGRKGSQRGHGKAGLGRKYEGWFEKKV